MRDLSNFSDWQKIDLHIHTDKSNETKDNDYKGIFSVSTLKEKLRDNNVSIFSLTDHNIINVEAYKEYVNMYQASAKDPFPLIGFEADILHRDRTYHALLIFEKDIVKNKEFIQTCAEKVEELYKDIPDKKKRKTTFETIIEKFDKNEFLFIVHSGNHKSIIDAYRQDIKEAQERILIFENIGVEQGKEDKIRKFNAGFQEHLQNYFKAENYVPYIDFSDNHYIEKYPCKGKDENNIHQFFYIKGIQNYESLRLAFIDPTIRILNDKKKNDLDRHLSIRTYIKELVIENTILKSDKETSIKASTFKFSPHLNVIIGGRSSGKSLLIDILGKKLTGIQKEEYSSTYNYDDSSQVKSNKDSSYVKQISIINPYLIYLKQNSIVTFFMNKDLSSLAKKSNKEEEYNSLQTKFYEIRKELSDKAKDLSDLYEDIISTLKNAQYKIYKIDLESLQLTGWSFKGFSTDVVDCNFGDKEKILENILDNIEIFQKDTFWQLTEDDIRKIQDFIELINSKKKILREKKSSYLIRKKFNSKISALLQRKNTEISDNTAKKQNSTDNIKNLIGQAKYRFQRFYTLKKLCDILENFKLYRKLSIELNDGIKIVKETLDMPEEHTFGKILLCDVLTVDGKENLYLAFNKFPEVKNKIPFRKKLENVLGSVYKSYDNPKDSLIYSDGSSSKMNSPGLNSEQYLKSILSNDNVQIIIIDQPEDNLGSTFITKSENSLVDIIRNEKFKKQIFLATHNASIVVFGDAESIIYAQNDGNEISYSPILIENNNTKQIICDNLDGGYEVFDNRRKKYNIKKLEGE